MLFVMDTCVCDPQVTPCWTETLERGHLGFPIQRVYCKLQPNRCTEVAIFLGSDVMASNGKLRIIFKLAMHVLEKSTSWNLYCMRHAWRGIVGNTFWLKRSYCTPGPVSTAMGDCLQAGKSSQCEACQLGRLSLLPFVGR